MAESDLKLRWQQESEAAWLYDVVQAREPDARRAQLFGELAHAARRQADILAASLSPSERAALRYRPGLRARLVAAAVRALGPQKTRPWLAAMKVRGLSVYDAPALTGHPMPNSVEHIGARHRTPDNLRAAVFGINDGLLSNTSLLMGMLGSDADIHTTIVTGVTGALAGALSMAAGEYVSVRSQRELYEYQIAQEREELETYPDEEAEELALIYAARGVPLDEARHITQKLIQNKEQALDTLAREELGINPSELGSPWGAAWASFTAFAVGATAPLLPVAVLRSTEAILWVAAVAAISLFAVGAGISLFSGRGAILGGLRMLCIGSAAGGTTFALGKLLGLAVG